MNTKEGTRNAGQIIHGLEKRIAELEKERGVMLEVIKAVAHVGVDFGYGKYELESDKIDKARAIFEALKEQGGFKDGS